ncbi:carbohydrate ABC transporter permease [Pelagovum pacificum]|uniref:Carbohydrate ABC transporter permease n=1 Tax=Pelagovum pacificum TaxID=2588711 RepID=A0A5C5GAQ2_9RHOB|nr:carbohydrate ABC transporter permease [Pelagovum pacificum]QQA41767.1 carbohydrate ABC transporter permease [Pelagovum pacificum]TNY31040.1 carbohydrate ABC transporter permease [Pelagovum pacificum]
MTAAPHLRHARNFRYLGGAFLAVAVLSALVPLGLVVLNSFKSHADIVANPLSMPVSFDLSNFSRAWSTGDLTTGLVNSLLICGSTVFVTLTFASLAAFPLARRKIRGWRLVSLYFLVAVTVPIQLFMFPLYYIYATLGVVGNWFATSLILSAINLPLAIFLLRTYVLTIPVELDDAARMDGAKPLQIWWMVILPLMTPGLLTVGTLVFLQAWNEFLVTSTFQQGQANFTMTLGYLSMNSVMATDRGIMMAGALLIILPIVVLFLAMQRFFVDGMTAGAIKG